MLKPDLKEKTLQHYDRMIAWAEAQNPSGLVTFRAMFAGIRETWGSENCPYCMEVDVQCTSCILKGNSDSASCCNGLWKRMSSSKTWKEWAEKARDVRKYVEDHG